MKVSEAELSEELQLAVRRFYVSDHENMQTLKLIKMHLYAQLTKKKLKENQGTKTTYIMCIFKSE